MTSALASRSAGTVAGSICAPDVAIDVADHGRKAFFRSRPVFLVERTEVRNFKALFRSITVFAAFVVGVRNIQCEVQEERFFAMVANVFHRFIGQQIRCIVDAFFCDSSTILPAPLWLADVSQSLLVTVANQKLRIEIVSVPHADVTEEVIEPVIVGIGKRQRSTNAPFPDAGCFVTCRFEDFCNGDILRLQQPRTVSANPAMPGMLSRHQNTSRRRTDGATGIVSGEPDSFAGHAIDVWRGNVGTAVTSKVSISGVVGQNVDDVGFSTFCGLILRSLAAGVAGSRDK